MITIRAYAASDWDALVRIHDSARLDELRDTVGLEAFLDLETTFENEGLFDGVVWVAELDGHVVGFIAIDDHEITWTYVDPQHYRRGVGRALLRFVLDSATGPVELEVLEGNAAAQSLYESVGFVVTSTKTGKLAGNESFAATGHMMTWTPPPR